MIKTTNYESWNVHNHFVSCYSLCNQKREAAQLVRGVERAPVPRCSPGAALGDHEAALIDGGGGGRVFSSPDLLFGVPGDRTTNPVPDTQLGAAVRGLVAGPSRRQPQGNPVLAVLCQTIAPLHGA